jgi:hypothetical protein
MRKYHQNIKTYGFVIVSNHIHGIIVIAVGADSISAPAQSTDSAIRAEMAGGQKWILPPTVAKRTSVSAVNFGKGFLLKNLRLHYILTSLCWQG